MDHDDQTRDARDLVRYRELLRRARAGLRLSRAEACLVCDALNGVALSDYADPSGGASFLGAQMLGAEVADAIALNRLHEKWGLDDEQARALAHRLHTLPLLHRVAFVDAVEAFWRRCTEDTDVVLRDVGLVVDDESRVTVSAIPTDAASTPPANERVLREVIDLLDQTRHTFKSRQVARARELLEELLR